MRTIIILMLAVQVGIFLVAAYTVMLGRPKPTTSRLPIWSSLAIALVIVAGASWNIADRRAGEPGADILMFGAPLLLGMGLMAVFMLFRLRRGLDPPS